MAKRNDTPENSHDLRRQVREIADSLAIAFILAMVIRHFVLEVFKIPTKSMEPTLLGDPWTGDKILVNKFAYDFRSPRRWEIGVFKYPEDTSKNYIKRIVGLPGERVRVRDGDLYINGQIARKPWRVQAALWRLRPHSGEAEFWEPSDTSRWDLADGDFLVACENAPEPQVLEYRREILAYEERDFRGRGFHRMTTGDIMVQFRLEPQARAGYVSVEIETLPAVGVNNDDRLDYWKVVFPLDESPCRPQVHRLGKLVHAAKPCPIQQGRATLIQVCTVDRTIIVRADGRELLRAPFEPSRGVFEWAGFSGHTQVRLGCKQGRARFLDTGVYVDLHYTDSPSRRAVHEVYQLGDDEFFVLGDNSCNSNDSRGWRRRGGVPRDYLVGEAFLVLWPLGRMKLVR